MGGLSGWISFRMRERWGVVWRSTASAGVLSSASEPDVRCFSLFPFRGIQSREVRCLGLLFLDLPSLGIPVGRAAPAA